MEQLDPSTLKKLSEYKSKANEIKQKILESKIEKYHENKIRLQEQTEKKIMRKELERLREKNIKRREIERNADARNRWLSLRGLS